MNSFSAKDRKKFEEDFQKVALPLILWLENNFPDNFSAHITNTSAILNEAKSIMLLTPKT